METMYALGCLLVLYQFQHPDTATNAMEELQEIFQKMFETKEKNEQLPNPVSVFIDLVLELLSAAPDLFIHISVTIISALSPRIKKEDLQLILDLVKNEFSSDTGFEDDEDMEVELEEEEEEEDDEEEEEEEDDDEDDNEGDDDDDDEEEEDEDSETNGYRKSKNENKDEVEEDDEVFDDEKMFSIDRMIVTQFALMKQEAEKKNREKIAKKKVISSCVKLLHAFIFENKTSPISKDLLEDLKSIQKSSAKQEINQVIRDYSHDRQLAMMN